MPVVVEVLCHHVRHDAASFRIPLWRESRSAVVVAAEGVNLALLVGCAPRHQPPVIVEHGGDKVMVFKSGQPSVIGEPGFIAQRGKARLD